MIFLVLVGLVLVLILLDECHVCHKFAPLAASGPEDASKAKYRTSESAEVMGQGSQSGFGIVIFWDMPRQHGNKARTRSKQPRAPDNSSCHMDRR